MTLRRTLRTAAARMAGLVAALSFGLTVLPTPSASAYTTAYGSTSSADHVLSGGCHRYRYHYRITPPTRDWTLETFLSDPAGKRLATNQLIAGTDPERGHHLFRVCRQTTRFGRFTIKAKLTYYTSSGFPTPTETAHKAWLKPSHFRMRRP